MTRIRIFRLLSLAALAATLTGCDTWRSSINYIVSDSDSVCPDAAILANTATIPVFDPKAGADPTSLAYQVKMSNLSTRCDYNKRRNDVDANLHIQFTATRAPGGGEAHYRVPYFVAVTSGGEIVDKQMHWLDVDFAATATEFSKEELVDSIMITMARQKRSYEYHLLIGFQLTQAQMDYNKKMGQYLP